jgi:hypothetical protein
MARWEEQVDIHSSIQQFCREHFSRSLPAFLLLLTVVGGCDSQRARTQPAKPVSLQGGIIDQPGTLPSPSGRYKLETWIDPNKIVQYRVVDTKSNREVLRDNAGSTYSTWYACWGKQQSVWFYSGDIGTSVWIIDASGQAREAMIWRGELAAMDLMPQMFYNASSSNTKQDFDRLLYKRKRQKRVENTSQPSTRPTSAASG